VEKPPQLNPTEAYDAIQRLLKEGDTIGRTQHARDRALERNVTIDDMRNVLVKGTVSPRAEWKDNFQNWNYVISGRDCDGEPLVLVIALEPRHCRITVITVKDVSQ
jgi:hypothetical protein